MEGTVYHGPRQRKWETRVHLLHHGLWHLRFLPAGHAVWRHLMISSVGDREGMARTGRDPSELYADLTRELGAPIYERIGAPATSDEKDVLLKLSA